MKKFWLLSVLILSSNCYATLILIPTIDGDDSIWLEREGDIAFAESPFILGVTTPNIDLGDFYLFFQYDEDNILLDISNITSDSINFKYDGVPGGMVFCGYYDTPGMLFDNVIVTGLGDIDIYKDDWYLPNATYLGTISVIPEPTTLILLVCGAVLLRRRK